MVVCPWHRFTARLGNNGIRELWSKTESVDLVSKHMAAWEWRVVEVVEVMHVHVAVAETPSGGDVEVSNHFVDSDASLYPAPLAPLSIQSLRIVFPRALLDILASFKSPGHASVCIADLFTSITAPRLLCIWRRRSAKTFAAVVRGEMRRRIIGVPKHISNGNGVF